VPRLVEMDVADLSPGDVMIRVEWSGVNFKDALAVTGRGRILKRTPLNAGIDLAGRVERSADPRFAAGDAVLRHVAQVVSRHTRTGDVLGRTGGEEFAMLLPDTAPDEAEALSERLRHQVSLEPVPFAEHRISVTVSIGIAVLAASDADAGAALMRADRALYEAKDAGRNAVRRWQLRSRVLPP